MLFLTFLALVAWVGPHCVAAPQSANSDLSLRGIPHPKPGQTGPKRGIRHPKPGQPGPKRDIPHDSLEWELLNGLEGPQTTQTLAEFDAKLDAGVASALDFPNGIWKPGPKPGQPYKRELLNDDRKFAGPKPGQPGPKHKRGIPYELFESEPLNDDLSETPAEVQAKIPAEVVDDLDIPNGNWDQYYKRDADIKSARDAAPETEQASCLCPVTQKAVYFSGHCQCIDDSFGGGKRDAADIKSARDAAPETEQASCLCPINQIAVHFSGRCECIDDSFGGGKRDAAPETQFGVIRGGGSKRANLDSASSRSARKAFCLRRICPNNLKPHFINGPYNPINGNCVCSKVSHPLAPPANNYA